jgi:hypothetical protein
MDNQRKQYRTIVNQLALYSNGSYTVQDMYNMTFPQLEEIQDVMKQKIEAEKQAYETARGTNRKTF